MKPPRRLWWLAGLATAILSIAGTGCKKEKDSLIVASLKTEDSNGASLRSLTLTVGSVSHTFPLTAGLTTTPIEFGLYLPSDITGTQNVSASATEPTGCRGYKGEQSADVSMAGSTVPVSITMKPATVCEPDGGAAGSTGQAGAGGGAGGQAGAAGTLGSGGSGGHAGSGSGGSGAGGAPPPGTPPSLKTCVEYMHDDPSVTCDNGGDTAVWSVAFSPNGQLLVTAGDDGRAVVWRFDGRKPTLEGHVLQGSGYGLVAFSPDGTQLAYGGVGQIALYSVATWTLTRTLAVTNTIVDLAYTQDGQQIISSDSDGTIGNVYSHSALAGGSLSPTHTLPFNAATPNSVAVAAGTASGTPVAVATGEPSGSSFVGKVLIYSLTSTGFVGPSSTLAVASDSGAYTVRISPNGSELASSGADGLVYLWPFPITSVTPSSPNIDVGTAFSSDNIDMVAFSPNNSYIAVAGGFFPSASIWGVAPPRSGLGSNVAQSGDVVSIVFSPSGNAIVAGEYDCGLFQVCAD